MNQHNSRNSQESLERCNTEDIDENRRHAKATRPNKILTQSIEQNPLNKAKEVDSSAHKA